MVRSSVVAALAAALATSQPARAQEHEAPASATHEPAAHEEHATHDAAAQHGHSSPWELKLSLETPLFTHLTTDAEGSRSTNIGRTFELGVSAGLAYQVVPHIATIDVEITQSELFGSELEEGAPHSTGVTLRLGGTYRPVEHVPVYLLAMTTYHLDPFLFGVRGGVGFQHHLGRGVALVLEAALDFPIAGSGDAPGAFKQQQLVFIGGFQFHL